MINIIIKNFDAPILLSSVILSIVWNQRFHYYDRQFNVNSVTFYYVTFVKIDISRANKNQLNHNVNHHKTKLVINKQSLMKMKKFCRFSYIKMSLFL